MDKLMSLLKLSIAAKHFLFLFLSTLLLFGGLSISNMSDSIKIFRNQVIYDSNSLLNNTNQFLNLYMESIQNIMLTLSDQAQLRRLEDSGEASSFLKNYAEIHSSIVQTIYFIREEGEVYSSQQVHYDILGNPNISRLYELARKNFGGISWSEPYHSPLSAGETVAFVSPVVADNNQFHGAVVVEINLDHLSEKLSPMLFNKNQTFVVLTPTGEVVTTDIRNSLIPYEPSLYPRQPSSYFIDSLTELPAGVSSFNSPDLSLVAIKTDKNRLEWSLVALIDEADFNRNINTLYANYRHAATILVIIVLVSSLILSRYLTSPIRKLANRMDSITSLTEMPRISSNRKDEIGKLTNSYNGMIDRIQYLFKKNQEMEQSKKEYELNMLQSQIGPHFLSNTLACIGSLAKQNKTDEVRKTIRSLVGLLSFSFDKRSKFVTLAEELKSIQMYLQIQQMRFGDKFSMSFEIEEEALQYKMLKLTLQPIIENAIFHGVASKPYGKIVIKSKLSENRLKIFIRDNGVGIEKEVVRELLVHKEAERYRGGFNSIGLINVHERIQIYFGQCYGLKIASKKHVGTVVRILLPKIKGD